MVILHRDTVMICLNSTSGYYMVIVTRMRWWSVSTVQLVTTWLLSTGMRWWCLNSTTGYCPQGCGDDLSQHYNWLLHGYCPQGCGDDVWTIQLVTIWLFSTGMRWWSSCLNSTTGYYMVIVHRDAVMICLNSTTGYYMVIVHRDAVMMSQHYNWLLYGYCPQGCGVDLLPQQHNQFLRRFRHFLHRGIYGSRTETSRQRGRRERWVYTVYECIILCYSPVIWFGLAVRR